jgi:hypothetical protein
MMRSQFGEERGRMTRASCAGLFAWLFIFLVFAPGPAFAQGAARIDNATPENLMKICGDQWRAMKETEAARGTTWPQYLARCRAEAAQPRAQADAAPAAPRATGSSVSGAKPQPSAQVSQQASAQSGGLSGGLSAETTPALVFPSQVSARFASERPQRARQKTCSEQFQTNKAANANGGLRWVEKGGGYWSKCNAHLKQARA